MHVCHKSHHKIHPEKVGVARVLQHFGYHLLFLQWLNLSISNLRITLNVDQKREINNIQVL